MDLTRTYTLPAAAEDPPKTVGVDVRRRTAAATGEKLITVTGLPALLADRLDAIPDAGDRGHTLIVLHRARIVISDTAHPDWDTPPAGTAARDGGRLRTTYTGGAPGVSVDDVLDVAEQLRAELGD